MARTTDRNRRAAASSGAALAAVMLSAPTLAAPAPAPAAVVDQTPATASRSTGYEKQMSATRSAGYMKFESKFKHKDEYSVAGVGDGHVVFEDERGQTFYVDGATGDQKFVTRNAVIKMHKDWVDARTGPHKMPFKYSILGVDQDGKTIMSNAGGENFTLDAATGDMIFIPK